MIHPTTATEPTRLPIGSGTAERTAAAQRRWQRQRLVRWLTIIHVGGTAGLWYLVWEVSETWWVGCVVTFLPRLPWLVPGVVLALASLFARSRTLWLNLATVLFTLVTICGFNIPWQTEWDRWTTSNSTAIPDDRPLRLVSCNVQSFRPDFSAVLREAVRFKPDVVAFQEAFYPRKRLAEQWPDWHSVHVRGFWVGSKWPVRLLGQCDSDVFQRTTAIAVEVDAPFGKFVLMDLHLMTARKSLIELRPASIVGGEGPQVVTTMLLERDEEARQTRAFIADSSRGLPTIVVGDFNMPTSSSIYRSYFDDFRNTFEAASWGCGYTAPCRPIRFWPANTPWQRIDHILTGRPWQVLECHIGQRDGSDHRLIAATLQLRSHNETDADPETSVPVDLSDEVKALELDR